LDVLICAFKSAYDSPARMMLESGTRLGPYEIINPIGAGGMGEVYRARDTRLDRLVAVKVLPAGASAQALERFTRETKAIAALNHPGICAVYDVGTTPVSYLVMELLDGETLHQRLARGAMDLHALVDIGTVVADALATAHARGIVHRDLKPANIVLTRRGPKILDFGLARVTETASAAELDVSSEPTITASAPLTDAGAAIGTLAYMSPEQLRGEPLDPRTDLFSLGLVLYEMATGRRAFHGGTSAVTSAAILHDQPAAPRELRPELPERLQQAILTLLEKDREVRTQTAAEVRAELTRLKREFGGSRASDSETRSVADETGADKPARSAAIPPPSSSDVQLFAGLVRRHRGVVAGLVGAGLIAAAGVLYVLLTRGGGDTTSDRRTVSIADLKIEALTTSGTAALPAISPDGKYVVYIENGGGMDSLRVRQVATGSNVEIVKGQPGVFITGATVTPDGAFVNYVRVVPVQQPELWQIPFLGGAAKKLLAGPGGKVSFSPDGREMAFVRGALQSATELVIASADGTNERVVVRRQPPRMFFPAAVRQSFAPAWSPDGAVLALMGGREGEDSVGQIIFVDVNTGSERAVDITRSSVLVGTGLTWLDERSLLISMFDRVSAPFQLWLLSYPDGKLSRFTNDTNQYVSPSLTADRTALVANRTDASFSVLSSDDSAKTWTQTVPVTAVKGPIGFRLRWIGDDLTFMATAGSGFALTRWNASTRATEIIGPSGGLQSVSRDGSTIVYYDYDASERWKIDAAGRNRVRLARGQGPESNGQLSPDGRSFAHVGRGPKGLAVVLQSMDEPSRTRQVTADRVRGAAAEISPDGHSIAFTAFNDSRQPVIAVCDLETCSSRRTLPPILVWHWTPDSQGLAYYDPRTSNLWVQPVDGSPSRQLTHFPAEGQLIWDFDWSADGKRLAVARGRIVSDIVLFRGLRPPAP
jgi:eukaryotic-like serine/threonine-protein kinase